MENEQHHFLDVGENGRDSTKWAEKPYFHCGSHAQKVIKNTQYYL